MDPTTTQDMRNDFKSSWSATKHKVRVVSAAAFAMAIFGGLGIAGLFPEWSMLALAFTGVAALMQAGALHADVQKKEGLEHILDQELTAIAHGRGGVRSARKKPWTQAEIEEAVDFVYQQGFMARLYARKKSMLDELALAPPPINTDIVALGDQPLNQVNSGSTQDPAETPAHTTQPDPSTVDALAPRLVSDDTPNPKPQLPRVISYSTKPNSNPFL